MVEHQKVLNKLEEWAERLPYRSLKIEVEMSDQTLVLEKSKTRAIGFRTPAEKEGR